MICMAPSTTTKIVEEFSDDYDAKVMSWSGDISKVDELIKLKYFVYFAFITEFNYPDSNVAWTEYSWI